MTFDPQDNYRSTMALVGYVPRTDATPETYTSLGFKCGLEIHQQLKTEKKLFCHCPCGKYQKPDDFDAEVIRHMRPTLSEMGEYDGTALMERKTRKNIVYRLKNETACTYEIDDTPPFSINEEALNQAIEIALLLKTNVVGELHITRKQYLDGSIPTGFQRTAIVGIEGEIPISNKTIRMIQLSIEEDACREISDIGHWRVYRTDRLGMPLIESVTYPDMLTPDEAAEAGDYLRYLVRSTGKVRTGVGAGRQDVNVSVTGGTRVEIKGVAHIKWIPELTHNEAFRQKAMLEIKNRLGKTVQDQKDWKVATKDLAHDMLSVDKPALKGRLAEGMRLTAINLSGFESILSFFTQPGKMFADEIRERLKVIACLEIPNMLHSEQLTPELSPEELTSIRKILEVSEGDAQIVVWGDDADVATAIETIEERCRMAFEGVPNETRKSLPGGITIFERVLPGADRMYPDTDSAPISIPEEQIERAGSNLPVEVSARMGQLREWKVPEDCIHFVLKRNLMPVIDRITADFDSAPRPVCILFGHMLKNLEGRFWRGEAVDDSVLYDLFDFVSGQRLNGDMVKAMLPYVVRTPGIKPVEALKDSGYKTSSPDEILAAIEPLMGEFVHNGRGDRPAALVGWIMGKLRTRALGNLPLNELKDHVEKVVAHG